MDRPREMEPVGPRVGELHQTEWTKGQGHGHGAFIAKHEEGKN